MTEQHHYAGLSEVELPIDSYDLGLGLRLRKTYAHLMAPHLMAFARAEPGQPHPPPWRTAKGGFSYDVTVELTIPLDTSFPGGLSARDMAWWIAALLRIAGYPYLAVPILSNQPFSEISIRQDAPDLQPFEIVPRILRAGGDEVRMLDEGDLDWLKNKWQAGAKMLQRSPAFFSAVRAFDFCTLEGKRSLSLLSVWTGLEQLFSPSPGELRFRVSSNIAAYLEPPGERRLALFKEVLKLYDARSRAAHTSSDIENAPLVQSFVIMRNALMKMIDEEAIPTQQVFEQKLFCVQ
jgi:Apea-like HEPN